MSLPVILLIMLSSGLIGGWISSFLTANTDPATGMSIRPTWVCVLIGIGATILVPLFLEIAQSKLMDNIHTGWQLRDTTTMKKEAENKSVQPKMPATKDKDSTNIIKVEVKTSTTVAREDDGLKVYLLFLGYCFLAAAAGPKFITNLIDSVLKDKQITNLQQQKAQVEQQKDKAVAEKQQVEAEKDKVVVEKDKVVEEKNNLEEAKKLQTIENHVNFEQAETKALQTAGLLPPLPATTNLENFSAESTKAAPTPKFHLGPITDKEDPQKGRFGGKSENNGRILKAKVTKSYIPEFYNVTISVESTDKNKPLQDDVIFYLHDSFKPAVYTIKPNEFKNGKAVDDGILSYGAFTVGAITDKGETLLELDLAENTGFPEKFRRR